MDCKTYYDKLGAIGIGETHKRLHRLVLENMLADGSVLDVGCGEGFFLEMLNHENYSFIGGCDISKERLKVSAGRLNGSASLQVADIRRLPFRSESIDQVLAIEVIEHIPEWKDAVSELFRVAKKKVIITVPYAEQLVSEKCHDCGAMVNPSGHLNSFDLDSFRAVHTDGASVDYRMIDPKKGLPYYARRAVQILLGIVMSDKTKTMGTPSAICSDCYGRFSYKLPLPSRMHRIMKNFWGHPEYMMVEINKSAC